MACEAVSIPTADGTCPATFVTPAGTGPWPAVILFMDGLGIRPTIRAMAERLAGHGYAVLVPDMYYRFGAYAPLVPAEVLTGGRLSAIGPMIATTGNARAAEDAGAFLGFLNGRGEVLQGRSVGTVGFCMGGAMAITAAGHYPERVAAAASFHGGNLASDATDSPHLLAPAITAELYVAVADEDPYYPAEMARRFEEALAAAKVPHRTELYPGALHGWMMPDFPVYDEAAAERGWRAMLELFDRSLRS